MRKSITRLLLLSLLGAISLTDVFAQFVTVLPNDNSTSGNARAPMNRYNRARIVFLIKPSEMAASGFISGSQVGGIGWTYQAAPGNAASAPLVVYMENTSDVTQSKSTNWVTATSTMTMVSNSTVTIANSTTPNITFSGGSPFTYTGGGVYVAYDWGCYSGTLFASVVMCNSTGLVNGLESGQTQTGVCPAATSTTLAASSFRPETRLSQPQPNNDLGISNIYTQGNLSIGYSGSEVVKARIVNNGVNATVATTANIDITGVNTFSSSAAVPALASGAAAIISFPAYTPTVIGANTVTITIPADDVASNNTLAMSQTTSKDINSYTYSTPPVTQGVGFTGATGDFVARFFSANNFGNSDTINGFQVFFTSAPGQQYQVGVWNDNAGVPGTNIYSTATQSTAAGTVFISLPDIEVSGTYYVGIRQLGTTNVGFGYQVENPIRSGDFFYTSPTGSSTWTDFINGGPANFRLSATVQYKTPQPPNCAVYLLPANAGVACQNGTNLTWGSGGGGPTGYRVYFGTNQALVEAEDPGTLVQNSAATSYATGVLTPGGIYYWRVTAYNAQGDATSCGTLSRSFTTNLVSCYCPTTPTNGTFEFVSNVTGNVLSNTTGSSLYTNYTGLGAIQNANIGSTFNLSVTVTSPFDEDRIFVYADFNHDGDWSDAGELCGNLDVIATQTVYSVPCTVPSGATGGTTLLRVKMGDEVDPTIMTNDPCQVSFTYGEVEDYLLNVTCGSTAGSNSPVCENGTLNLSSTYLGSGTPTVFSWTTTAASNYTSGAQNPIISGVTSANDAGDYTVVITDNNGCTSFATVTVTVNPNPDPQASSNAPICVGNPLGLSSNNNAPGQTTGNSYSWTGPSFTSGLQNPSVTGSATQANSGTYTVTISNQYGCTASTTTSVTVNDNPAGTAAVTGVSCVGLCDGGVVITPTAGLAPYIFTDGVTVNTDGIFTNAFCEGPASVDISDDNGCSATILFSVGHINTAPPPTSVAFPTVPAYACSGDNLVASTSTVSLATTYTWDGPAGTTFNSSGNPYTSGSTSVTVNYGPPNGSGYNICVQAGNGCGSTNRRCSFVRGTVNVPGTIAPANNRTVECASTSANYSIASVGGATSYTWSITGNATVIGTGTSATVNFGPGWTGGNLCVTANTPCYSSAPRCLALSSVTAAPGAITGSSVACPGSSGTYSIPVASGASTYNWVLPANTSGSSSTNSINVNFLTGFSLGNIKVSITSICGVTSSQMIKTVATGLPGTPATISGNAAGLCGQTTTYNCSSVSGATSYTWSTPVGTINSGQGSTSINVTFGSFATGNVCVTANNSCGSGAPRCIPVKGSPTISGSITYSPNPFCANDAGVDLQVPPAFGTSSYNWSFPSGVSVVLDLSNEQVVNWGSIGGAVSVTAVNSCGNTTKSITITLGCREAGSSEISSSDGDFNVFPNPASDKVNVSFTSSQNSHSTLRLMDLSGRVLSLVDFSSQKGLNNQLLDLSGLAKGVYMIELKSDNINKQTRIVIE